MLNAFNIIIIAIQSLWYLNIIQKMTSFIFIYFQILKDIVYFMRMFAYIFFSIAMAFWLLGKN